jgi:bifunctional non-homologous end joining protein LigD
MPSATTLYCREGRSDKEYTVMLESDGNGLYNVYGLWGPRGGSQQSARKNKEAIPLEEAARMMGRLLGEKMAKGYRAGEARESAPAPEPGEAQFISPMLCTELSLAHIQSCITSRDMYAQPKHDGIRMQVHRIDGRVSAFSRTGKPRLLPKEVAEAVRDCDAPHKVLIVDCEFVENELFVFDMLRANGSLEGWPLRKRLDWMDRFIPECGPFRRTITAQTQEEKRIMYETLHREGGEGMVFKRANSLYSLTVAHEWIKVKFVASATVKVLSHNARRSVNMGLEDGTDVGSVTIPPNRDIPPVGCLIEVRYLYARRGGCLIQPVYLGERDDTSANSADSPIGSRHRQGGALHWLRRHRGGQSKGFIAGVCDKASGRLDRGPAL